MAAWQKDRSMDPKLTLLFLLIGAIVGLSHLGNENLRRTWRPLFPRRWREFVGISRKI
jgi:hypothetical protein